MIATSWDICSTNLWWRPYNIIKTMKEGNFALLLTKRICWKRESYIVPYNYALYILHNKKLMSVITDFDAFNSSMTCVTCGAGIANHSGVPEFTHFSFGHCIICPSSICGFWLAGLLASSIVFVCNHVITHNIKMSSTLPLLVLGSMTSLLAVIQYKGNPGRKRKL